MIEPAAYGVATSFGPQTHNFRDIVRLLIRREAAVVVCDGAEMTAFVHNCLRDSRRITRLGDCAKQLVSEQLGAADKTLELFATFMPSKSRRRDAA